VTEIEVVDEELREAARKQRDLDVRLVAQRDNDTVQPRDDIGHHQVRGRVGEYDPSDMWAQPFQDDGARLRHLPLLLNRSGQPRRSSPPWLRVER
jgi:hypothetical protein